MKKVLIIQCEESEFDINQKAPSGTTRCGTEIFNYLNSLEGEYSCDYACTTPGTETALNKNHYDIVIFNHVYARNTIDVDFRKLKEVNPNIKSVLIAHGLTYFHLSPYSAPDVLNMFDKVVFVSPYGHDCLQHMINDKSKIEIICNPVNMSQIDHFKDFSTKKNQIIITYHPWKGNISGFALRIFPEIKRMVPDAELKICQPQYEIPRSTINDLRKDTHIEGVEILGSLSQDELFEEISKSKICFSQTRLHENLPYSVIEAAVNCVFAANEYADGVQNIMSDRYKTIHRTPNVHEFHDYAQWCAERLLNYEKYEADLMYERSYVMSKFDGKNILPLYKNMLDKL